MAKGAPSEGAVDSKAVIPSRNRCALSSASPTWALEPLDVASDEWATKWDRFNRANWDNPLLSTQIVQPALRRLARGSVRLATAHRGGSVVAMALVRPSTFFAWTVFQPSQLPMPALLIRSGEGFEEVVTSIFSALPPQTLALSIPNVDTRWAARPVSSLMGDFLPHMTTGAIEWSDDFEGYSRSLPASVRQNINRRTRRAEEAFGKMRLECIDKIDRVDDCISLYASIEFSGWKGRAGTAVRVDDAQGKFYREMMANMARAGQMRIFVLRFGEIPVAQQLAIEYAGVLYLLKTAYDEKYRQYAPGVLQRMHVLRWAANSGLARVEICGRLKEWQQPFITSTREIYHATYFRSPAIRRLRGAVGRTRRWISNGFSREVA